MYTHVNVRIYMTYVHGHICIHGHLPPRANSRSRGGADHVISQNGPYDRSRTLQIPVNDKSSEYITSGIFKSQKEKKQAIVRNQDLV